MTVPFPFVANAVLTAAQLNAITSLPTTAKTASATLTAAESVGYRVTMTSATATTITINTGVFATGDTVFITNLGTATCTITAGTATITSAGSLVLTQYGSGLLVMTATGSGVWYASSGTTGYVTALPASPVDGQEVVLTDSLTAGTYAWRFRYNANAVSTFKWDFIGGAPAVTEVTTAQSTTSTTYVDLATVGPSFTMPRAGDYVITIGCFADGSTIADAGQYVAFKRGSASTSDSDAAHATSATAGHGAWDLVRTRLATGWAANDVVKLQYRVTGGSTPFADRYLSVTPVRVS
ncbi:hypothetical protein UFOVP1208_3 [uncultured Caudovirales phage]|uniref:Uncharacterized protein n=1 Tax=uncultured Caudovirales phage TaxID=2100421 RepID=A0A6J5QXU7_9CAUD|nr:hypothetical protein UFOVP980_20 [uncultured Caudovirales phage]CAB4189480.1 hypothetical protein UFOVP1208_3 [uncultured Caudovirales phage]CAB4194095.1 hypothetical protein UFOVP1263_12 [uncultured Caudovirales phage]